MKIAFDLRRIKNPGIGRYMKCLVEAILAQEPGHDYLLIVPPDAQDAIFAENPRVRWLGSRLKYYSLREQMELPRILRAFQADLLHSPHFLLPVWRPCPVVVTIHDVIYLACKEYLPSRAGRLYYHAMMAASVRLADRIITVSEYSKSEIVRFLNVDPARIEVIHSGVGAEFQPMWDKNRLQGVRQEYGIAGEYILYAGVYGRRKNHAGLLRAFRCFLSKGGQAQLVIAGPMNEGESALRALGDELGISRHVLFTGFVEDSALPALYSGARVYACPSLYEGFGFTVLEAMACGTPVVCSPQTSLPEVAGDAACYADARNPEEFGDALYRLFSDAALQDTLVKRGRNNLLRFSWKNAAAQTFSVYRNALGIPTVKAAHA
jgi:glycosyltransferase involved in cell wall biosynthesis